MLPLIEAAAARHGLQPELVRAVVWRESCFDRLAVGAKGEVGLMQLMDGAVADWSRVTKNPAPSRRELFVPETNLEIGCWYLARTGSHWEGYAAKEILQLAEYNAGRTKVLKDWAPKNPETALSLDAITYPSTKEYIKTILEQKASYEKRKPATVTSR